MRRIAAIVLIVLGALALVYKGFEYTRDQKTAKIGSLELSFEKKERVAVPVWAGLVLVGVGAGLLLIRR